MTSYVSVAIDTAVGHCLLWNYEEVLEILRAAGNVAATFAGHAHKVGGPSSWPNAAIRRVGRAG